MISQSLARQLHICWFLILEPQKLASAIPLQFQIVYDQKLPKLTSEGRDQESFADAKNIFLPTNVALK